MLSLTKKIHTGENFDETLQILQHSGLRFDRHSGLSLYGGLKKPPRIIQRQPQFREQPVVQQWQRFSVSSRPEQFSFVFR